jgi:NADPH:quinone reductase
MPEIAKWAVIGHHFGPPESYELERYDPGDPAAGEVRVAIKAAGISYVDVLTARGEYQFKPPLPFIPGSEYAGVVEALGEGVTHLSPGDRVFGSSLGNTLASAGCFNAANVRKIPDALDFAEASVFPVNYMTAYHALTERGHVQPGETVLVLGAAGGTGYAAIQMAKYLGARVIASASTEEKRALALAGGADAVVQTGALDWRDQVKAANGGKPIDVVFDPVGGEATELAFRTLGYGGRHLVVGFPAGLTSLKTNLALLKSASLVGVHMRHFSLERPHQAAADNARMFEIAASGVLKPAIAKTYRMEDYAGAMNAAFSGKSAGRIVMTM